MKNYIIPAMIYLIGATTGCATNHAKPNNIDTLLQEEVRIPQISILKDQEETSKTRSIYKTRSAISSEDLSQYFIEEKETIPPEPVFDMDVFYANCRNSLRGTPPPFSNFSCTYLPNKRDGKCNVTLEGATYQLKVPTIRLKREGAIAAYHTLMQKPGQLEQIASKHCAPKEFAYAPERI